MAQNKRFAFTLTRTLKKSPKKGGPRSTLIGHSPLSLQLVHLCIRAASRQVSINVPKRNWRDGKQTNTASPPYQYAGRNCLINRQDELRIPTIEERECMMGFPVGYTHPCLPKQERKTESYKDCRLTLVGNSWSVPVVAWFLSQLLAPLGFCMLHSSQDIMDLLHTGGQETFQGRLIRLPLRPIRLQGHGEATRELAQKLGNLVSIKGEDLLLTASSSEQVKFHRLRASIPSRLWHWKVVAGWSWTGSPEHINSLELRAVLTTPVAHLPPADDSETVYPSDRQSSLPTRLISREEQLPEAPSKSLPYKMLSCLSVVAKECGGTSTRTRILLTAQVGGAGGSAPVSGMGKRILEGTTETSRASKRQKLGTLRQLTVQPSTRRRYDKALDSFFDFLRKNQMSLPTVRDKLDGVVCDYLEYLWSQGFGRALASDLVAAL